MRELEFGMTDQLAVLGLISESSPGWGIRVLMSLPRQEGSLGDAAG